jgi:DNA-binding transcriptional regulator YiaG
MTPERHHMTPDQYRAAIARLGLSQVSAAKFLGVNERTSRDWANPSMDGPPAPVAKFLRFLIALGIGPEEAEAILEGEPG